MGGISLISQYGDGLLLSYSDGSVMYAPATNYGQWIPSNYDDGTNPLPDGPGGSESPNGVGHVTAGMIEAAVNSVGGSLSAMLADSQSLADAFNDAIDKLEPGNFNTKARLACLVGECAQETDWFKTFEEYAKSGPYVPYYGRGLIQLTWRDNYQAFTNYLNGKGLDVDFVTNYSQVATLPYAAYAAIYYFVATIRENKTLVEWCDLCDDGSGNWNRVSGIINAGDPYYVGSSYGLRNDAINAAYSAAPDITAGDAGEKAKQFGLSVLGRFYYSQDSAIRSNMLATNGGDCSSFVVLCYTEGAGYTNEQMGGSGSYPGYTGTLANAGTLVNNNGDEADMKVGDLMLCGSGYPWDHVVMYIGNNQVLSHGGPGNGPVVQSLSNNIGWWSQVQVRRYE